METLHTIASEHKRTKTDGNEDSCDTTPVNFIFPCKLTIEEWIVSPGVPKWDASQKGEFRLRRKHIYYMHIKYTRTYVHVLYAHMLLSNYFEPTLLSKLPWETAMLCLREVIMIGYCIFFISSEITKSVRTISVSNIWKLAKEILLLKNKHTS